MVQKGDIVNFYSTVASFQKGYTNRNPGVVIASEEPMYGSTAYYDKGHAYILWANGDMSREHSTYLEVISNG